MNRAAQLHLPPEPAPRPITATVRQNTRDAYLAGYGAPPQQFHLPVDTGYDQRMTLAGIGGSSRYAALYTSLYPVQYSIE